MSRANRCLCLWAYTFLLQLVCLTETRLVALDRTWVGSNGNWDGSTANWNPADEPDSNDRAIFNAADQVTMTINQTIEGLILSNGVRLSTSTQSLNVNGTIDLDDANTTLIVHTNALLGGTPPVVSVNADDVIVTGGAEFLMANDVTIHDTSTSGGSDGDTVGVFTVGAGSALAGNGRLLLNNSISSPTVLFQNNGTIAALSYGNPSFVTASTLTLDAPDPESRIDLDGISGSSVVNVFASQTLDMNIQQSDDFDGTINVFHNATLDFEHFWELNGVLNIETGFVAGTPPFIPDTPAGVGVVRGGTIAMNETDSRINVVHNDGTLQLDAPLVANLGVIDNNGHLIVNSDSVVGQNVTFLMEFDADLTVNNNFVVNDSDWDWDDNGGSNNDITINDNGRLHANITAAGASVFSGDLHIVGGVLNVQGDNDDWHQTGGNITFESGPLGLIEGDEFVLTAGTFRAATGANGDVDAATTWNGGTLDVDGELELLGTVTWNGTNVIGDGILEQEGNATVLSDTTIAVDTYDWDQSTTTVNPGAKLTVNVSNIDRSNDTFNSNAINVNGGELLVTVADGSWTLGSGGTLNLSSPDAQVAQVSPAGSDLVVANGGVVNVSAAEAELFVPLTLQEGGEIRLSGSSPRLRTDSIQFTGGDVTDPSGNGIFEPKGLTVTGDTSITAARFVWDRDDTTVESSGSLTIDVDDVGADNSVDAVTITMNSGDIDIDVIGSWQMNGELRMNNTDANSPVLSSNSIVFGGNIQVGGDGLSEIDSGVSFVNAPTVSVAADTQLLFTGSQMLLGEVNFTGEGTVHLDSAMTMVTNPLTINMPDGILDLDGIFVGGNIINVQQPLTLNVGGIDGGLNQFDNDTIEIGPSGSLTVELPGSADWVMNGTLELNGATGAGNFAVQLAGERVELRGTVNVSDQSQLNANLDITGEINIAAGGTLRVNGDPDGNQFVSPIRLAGGVINGPGKLSINSARSLVGFGTVNADVDFDGANPGLFADDGELIVNGNILDLSRIGTEDTDAILNITQPWSTATTGEVDLNGGELRGATLTVANSSFETVRGHGLIRAPVNNNGIIQASGGTLTLRSQVGGDYDGSANTGTLRAIGGDFVFQQGNNGNTLDFHGTIAAFPTRTFTLDLVNLRFQPDSTLTLNDGTLFVDSIVEFGGAVNVSGVSTIEQSVFGSPLPFTSTSVVTLDGDLQLQTLVDIHAGATFNGTGALINQSTIYLEDNADVEVHLDNRTRIRLIENTDIAAEPTQASVGSLETSGRIEVYLSGISFEDYSRLSVDGVAMLGGQLLPSLIDGFRPQLDDVFTILTASSVIGEFDLFSTSLAPLDPGLGWDIIYNPTGVQLVVVANTSADADLDGDIDGADFLILQRTNPSLIADWQAQYGLGSPANSELATVPEPTTMWLVAQAALCGYRRRRYESGR